MNHHSPYFLISLLLPLIIPVALLVAQDFGSLASPAQSIGPVQTTGQSPSTASSIESTTTSFSPNLAPDQRPKDAHTIIESEGGAIFESATSTAEFIGHVIVHDPQFDLSCDRLRVILGKDHKGLSKVIAIGSVIITQFKKNDRGDIIKSIGKSGKITYDALTGDVTMEDWPQIQQGINNQVAMHQNTVMILNAKGKSRTIGASRTEIVDQGEKALTP